MSGMWRGSGRFLTVMSIVALAFSLVAAQAGEVPPAPPPPDSAAEPAPPVALVQPPVWLGVYLENADDGGVQVIGLVPGGPAARGGVREGDVLLGVGATTVLDLASLNETLRTFKPGQRAEIKLLRDGKTETLALLLGDRTRLLAEPGRTDPDSSGRWSQLRAVRFADPLGVGLQTIPPELRRHYGAPPEAGTLVVRVDPQGPGASSGLRVGDVVVRAGLRDVADPADVTAGIFSASTAEVPLEVIRGGKRVKVVVSRPAVPRPPKATPDGYAGTAPDAKTRELAREVERLRARVAELEAELEKARKE
jgi:hypothetical protein